MHSYLLIQIGIFYHRILNCVGSKLLGKPRCPLPPFPIISCPLFSQLFQTLDLLKFKVTQKSSTWQPLKNTRCQPRFEWCGTTFALELVYGHPPTNPALGSSTHFPVFACLGWKMSPFKFVANPFQIMAGSINPSHVTFLDIRCQHLSSTSRPRIGQCKIGKSHQAMSVLSVKKAWIYPK